MAENVFPIPQTPPIPTQKKASALKSAPLKTANANDVSTSGTTTKPKYRFKFNERIPASLLTTGLYWGIPIYAEGQTSGYSEFPYFYLWKYDGEEYANYRYLIFGYDDSSGGYRYNDSTDEFVLDPTGLGDHRTILILEDLDAETIAQLSALGTLTPIGEPKYHFLWYEWLPEFPLVMGYIVISNNDNYYMTANRIYYEGEFIADVVLYDSLFAYIVNLHGGWQDQSYRDIYIYTDLTSEQIAAMEEFGEFLSSDTKTVTATYNNQQLFSAEVVLPVAVTYNGSTIAMLSEGDPKYLMCHGKVMASDVVIGNKTLQCNGKLMASDVVVEVGGG